MSKELFLIWDEDGEGSLSTEEILKAFVKIGLSQDHHFGMKILQSIRPRGQKGGDQDIKIKDFIKIFKNDELSDHAIHVLNKEVKMQKLKHKFKTEDQN